MRTHELAQERVMKCNGGWTVLALMLTLVVLSASNSEASTDEKQPAAVRSEMLVSTQWLADHLRDPKVVILHVAEKRSDYEHAHIPGARFLAFDDFMTGPEGLMHELPPVEQLKKAFEKVGIGDDTLVVIYTTDWYPMAGRAYYTLDYLGHGDHASLLNGGIQEWEAEKRPLATGTDSAPVTKANFTPQVRENVRALLSEAKAVSQGESKNAVLLDSRPQKRYEAGHFPGAAHIFWEETVADPKKPIFLSPEKLRALFDSRGVPAGKKVVTYCEVGFQASHNYFVAKYLGYDDSMYDGSFHEWSHVEHLPLVKGSSPR